MPTKDMKVLLIGGAGYIGGVLTRYLLDRNANVKCLDSLVYGQGVFVLPFWNDARYQFILGDLSEPEQVRQACAGVDHVVFLGGLVGDPITQKYPDEAIRINQIGVQSALKAIAGCGVEKVVFISTCSNYGILDSQIMADENTALRPISAYARAKVSAEEYIMKSKQQFDYAPVILRFATAFGVSPRMRFDLTVNEFARDLYFNQALLVYDPDSWRPYCHVMDFSSAIHKVLEAPADKMAYEVFNVGSDENNYAKRMIAQEVCRQLGRGIVRYQSGGVDPRNYRVNFAKIREQLDFKPMWNLERGVQELLRALKMNLFGAERELSLRCGNYAVSMPKNSSIAVVEESSPKC